MKNEADYSLYKCPYEHLEKAFGHELHGPEGYENTYGIWCECGFRGPVFYLNPDDLMLEKKETAPEESKLAAAVKAARGGDAPIPFKGYA